MRIDARVDANQAEIVKQLRSIPGCKVQLLHFVGKGCPDIMVGWMKFNYLFEIKDGEKPPSKRKLTPAEKKWHAQWSGQVAIANCIEDCWDVMGIDYGKEIPL